MNRKAILCFLYTTLLIIPAPILGRVVAEKKEEKRNVGVLPIAAYAGTTVALPVFLALVAAYGVWAVVRYNIRSRNESHSCANNRGWCRPYCFRKEYIDWYHSDICGSNKFCRYH
ncbi:big defensin-like [Mytilus californianus]|uniref:big defensin-like n=1 Tax=Mytilus californianus TaxID=6549 RepID=UPI002247FEA7|nr:big defensin-like [Mytilus californianus]